MKRSRFLPRLGTDYRIVFDAMLAAPRTVVQIADATYIPPPEITRIMVDLRRRGLVERCGTQKAPYVLLGIYQLTEAAREAVGGATSSTAAAA